MTLRNRFAGFSLGHCARVTLRTTWCIFRARRRPLSMDTFLTVLPYQPLQAKLKLMSISWLSKSKLSSQMYFWVINFKLATLKFIWGPKKEILLNKTFLFEFLDRRIEFQCDQKCDTNTTRQTKQVLSSEADLSQKYCFFNCHVQIQFHRPLAHKRRNRLHLLLSKTVKRELQGQFNDFWTGLHLDWFQIKLHEASEIWISSRQRQLSAQFWCSLLRLNGTQCSCH